jgi:hypothetical protein
VIASSSLVTARATTTARNTATKDITLVRTLLAAALIALPVSALAQTQAKKIEECESITAPLAYNACLAKFGPARRPGGPEVTEVPPDADKKVSRRGGRRGKIARGRGGRAHAEFSVRKSKKAAIRGSSSGKKSARSSRKSQRG